MKYQNEKSETKELGILEGELRSSYDSQDDRYIKTYRTFRFYPTATVNEKNEITYTATFNVGPKSVTESYSFMSVLEDIFVEMVEEMILKTPVWDLSESDKNQVIVELRLEVEALKRSLSLLERQMFQAYKKTAGFTSDAAMPEFMFDDC